MRSDWSRVGLYPMTGILIKRESTDSWAEGKVTMEAETGVMCLQAKERHGWLATSEVRKRPGRILP